MTGQTISHYRILEKLGEGGMGVVYKAEDTKLRRVVALKFLPPTDDGAARERFLREARAAAALNHPNICTIHEVDEEHGFIAMECVEGVELKARIAERPLPLNEALDIAMQTAQGLEAAHQKGVTHRDIKPANIMVDAKGRVKIMDFGLAQVEDASRLTRTGLAAGTPAYMSPEQAMGRPLDRRSDLYSLGVVLYEMLTGRLPALDDPEPVTALRSGIPKEIDRITGKALAKDPAERYQHAADLAGDLRAVASSDKPSRRSPIGSRAQAAALALFAAGLALAGWFLWNRFRQDAPPAARSVAILPFRLLNASSADDYLGMGMADSVISKVSQIRGLTVRPTSAVRKYAAADTEAVAAAREMGVDAVLDGNLQKSSDRLRVSVNLLDAGSGASLWTETFNVPAADLFAVQDEVALRVASELRFRLDSSQQARMTRRQTSNPVAYEYYQKGMRYVERVTTMPVSDFEAGMALFRKALEADPNYALACAQLAHLNAVMGMFMEPDNPVWIDRARQELARAEKLDPHLAEAFLVRSFLLNSIHENYRLVEAIRMREAAHRLNPSLSDGELGNWYTHLGLDEQALARVNRAIEIDPLNQTSQRQKIFVLTILERHAEAIAEHQRLFNRIGPAVSLMAEGRLDEAESLLEEGMRRDARVDELGDWVMLQALRGRFEKIGPMIPKIRAARRNRAYHHATYSLAQAHALQGKSRETVEWLRETVENGMPNYPVFARDPRLSRIRQSPEFTAFMTELKPRWEKMVREIQEP